jgi:hypothetical protein
MRYFGAFRNAWLGRPNLEFTIHGNGVAIDDFPMKVPCKRQG